MPSSRRRVALITLALVALAVVGAAPASATDPSASGYFVAPASVAAGARFVVEERFRASVEGDGLNVVQATTTFGSSQLLAQDVSPSPFPNVARLVSGKRGDGQLYVDYIAGVSGGTRPGVLTGDYLLRRLTLRAGCSGSIALQQVTGPNGSAFYDYSGTGIPIPATFQPATVSITPRASNQLCVAPGATGQGAVKRKISVYGSGFSADSRVTFSSSDIRVLSQQVVSSGKVSATISVTGVAPVGDYGLQVTRSAGLPAQSCTSCVSITPAPIVTSTSPGTTTAGTTTAVSVQGSNLDVGGQLLISGRGVSVTNGSSVTVAADAPQGQRDVTWVNLDGGRGTCRGCFTVT